MPAYPVWAYYAHGRQRRCQEDTVSLPSGRLEKTIRSSPHHVAQHHPTGSETTPPYAHRSSRFGSEPPSVADDVDVWRYAILELHARNDDDDAASRLELVLLEVVFSIVGIIQTLLLLVCSSFQNIPIKFCTVIAKLFRIISCKCCLNQLRFRHFIMKRVGLQLFLIHTRPIHDR